MSKRIQSTEQPTPRLASQSASQLAGSSPTDLIESQLHECIPIAKAIGVKVRSASLLHVTMAAPLALNTNHASTAFGGSVYSVAVLSCWALVSQAVKEWGFDVDYVVVQDGHMDYCTPVTTDFEAVSSWRSESEAEKFRKMLAKKGLARASMRAVVLSQGRECATMEARFAARVGSPANPVVSPSAKESP